MGTPALTWLLSPGLAPWQKKIVADLRRRVPKDEQTVWVLSSGTQSLNEVKCIGLSHAGILASARAVNAHLHATKKDVWLVAIPEYHVGGYSIAVRASLSGSRVERFTAKWEARRFHARLAGVTLTSLVPTQIFDLVGAGLRAPAGLRAIVVGGGALDRGLYARARELGWPVLPSYGLTETASQVATAGLASLSRKEYPPLEVLRHAEFALRDGRLWVRAESACHWVARGRGDGTFTLEDPRREGWLPTTDVAEGRGRRWRIVGRADDVVKVLGVLVPLPQVEADAREHFRIAGCAGEFTLLTRPCARAGVELILVTDSSSSLVRLHDVFVRFNRARSGPERAARLLWTPHIPRTELGKIKKAELVRVLLTSNAR